VTLNVVDRNGFSVEWDLRVQRNIAEPHQFQESPMLATSTERVSQDHFTPVGDSIPSRIEKTQGEVEAAICEGVKRFEQEYMGRGPRDIRAHLLGDLLVVRLQCVLSPAEKQLAKSSDSEKGRDLLKQVRAHLIETAKPLLEVMVCDLTGIKVVSLHHDISTVTGEAVLVFTLREAPGCFKAKKR
jgi:uncharacterized protein YbcI